MLVKTCMIQEGTGGMALKNTMKEFPEKVRAKVDSSCQRQIHSMDGLKWQLLDVRCGLEQSTF